MNVKIDNPDHYAVVVTCNRGEQRQVVASSHLLSVAKSVAKGYTEDPNVWRVEIVNYAEAYYWGLLKPDGTCESADC